ncbi:MFS transporter [Cellulomonas citrea]|uniref:MFS transporter n=1 Tax=Cellulomonas citrea TaxID=1909423 RepID=UPI001358062F|nr:MFS transporter [Cellulomonas citrea]
MLSPYRDVLARPGALRFSAAGVLARMPMSMVGIGTVLMVQAVYGSYGLAGQVSGAYIVAQAVCSPVLANLVDRYGQARVMRPAVAVSAVGLTALLVAGMLKAPSAWVFVAAVVTGAGMGPFGALVRARWTLLLRDEPARLHAAYSWESALDEVVFIIGPVITTVLATSVHPTAGLVVPGVAMVVGGLWFLAQRRTAPPPAPRSTPRPRGTVLTAPGMGALLAVFVAIGSIFGATDVATVALATEQGHKALAGVILGAFGVGSLLAGLVYGTRALTVPLSRRFLVGTVALALCISSFALVTNLWELAIAMLVTGLTIAPTIINGNALVSVLVPGHRLTEGLTFLGTSIGVGVSVGSAVAGAMIDAHGSRGGFFVAAAAGIVVLVSALAAAPTLRRQSFVETADPEA